MEATQKNGLLVTKAHIAPAAVKNVQPGSKRNQQSIPTVAPFLDHTNWSLREIFTTWIFYHGSGNQRAEAGVAPLNFTPITHSGQFCFLCLEI